MEIKGLCDLKGLLPCTDMDSLLGGPGYICKGQCMGKPEAGRTQLQGPGKVGGIVRNSNASPTTPPK